MSEIRIRIEKTIKAIAKAEANGKDSTMWQEYLIGLIDELDKPTVRVKVGRFGFCTCTEAGGLNRVVIVKNAKLIPKRK